MYLFRNLVNRCSIRGLSVSSALSEKFGYKPEDASYILDRLNDLNNISGGLIGAANKKKLGDHLKQKGALQGLEDLLRVHGLGPKSVKRICDKLISVRGDGVSQVSETAITSKRRFRLPVISPPISETHIAAIKTVGSVSISASDVTWTKVNCISKNLEAWDSINLDTVALLKKPDIFTIITLCKDVVERLPVCDTYILEDLTSSAYGVSASLSQPKNLITSILTALLHQPPSGGPPKVVLITGRAVAKWSGRLIGSEKISSQSILSNIIVNLSSDDLPVPNSSHLPVLYADPSLRSLYLSSQPSLREALADAVLLALAFVDIALLKRDSIFQPYS